MNYLFDTSVWIEMFLGTKKGEKARKIVDDQKNVIIVADVAFAELYNWSTREDHDPGLLVELVREIADVFEIYTNIWVEAADARDTMRKKNRSFGLADALLLAIQKRTGAKIVSCDSDFAHSKNVVML